MKDNENKSNPESKVTPEDKRMLGDKSGNLRQDGGDDQMLKNRERKVDFAGEDLDIPGRDLPNKHTDASLKSEENQHHSLGSEHNEDLEQTEDIS